MSPPAAPCTRAQAPRCCVSLPAPRGPPGECFSAQPCYRENPTGQCNTKPLTFVCGHSTFAEGRVSFSYCLLVSFYYHSLER